MHKSLLLLSGGIDSPVAAYLMQKKGIEITAIHFSGEPFTTDEPERKSIEICKLLNIKKIYTIKFGDIQSEYVNKCDHRLYYILTRRLMLIISEEIAKKEDCKFLITGDNLGQVGSQTLRNMATITNAIKIKVLRPLLTLDKNEIIKIANEINTYEISKGPEMCAILGPNNPATKSDVKKIEKQEEKINLEELKNKALNQANLSVMIFGETK